MTIELVRSAQTLAVPRYEFLPRMRHMLITYQGRVGITLEKRPEIVILGKVFITFYDVDDDCVEMRVDVGGGKPRLVLLFYPEDIWTYYAFGRRFDFAHEKAKNETGNDCPASVQLLENKRKTA